MTQLHGQRIDKLMPMLVTSRNPDLALPLCYLSGALIGVMGLFAVYYNLRSAVSDRPPRPRRRPDEPPLNADDLATALTNGAAGWLVLSVAAVLPMLWTFTLVAALRPPDDHAIPAVADAPLRRRRLVAVATCCSATALLVITLGLSMIFFMPNLYFVEGCRSRRRSRRVVLLWALCVKIIRDPDEDSAAFRLLSILLVVASVLYIVPQIYGLEAADQANLGDIPSLLTSSTNLAVARPIFWVSLALFAVTAGVMFVRAVLQIRDPETVDPRRRRLTDGTRVARIEIGAGVATRSWPLSFSTAPRRPAGRMPR